MSKTSLLINKDLWRVLPEVIKTSKHTSAAFAYFERLGGTPLHK